MSNIKFLKEIQMTETKSKPIKPSTALVLRCCAADMTSRDGFVWPGVGKTAAAPDWRDDLKCGGGLHGWLYGAGDYTASVYSCKDDAKWLVLEVEESGICEFDCKCKFPSALVRFVGDKAAAAAYLVEHEPRAVACDVIGLSVVAGDHQTAAAGPLGNATSGDWGNSISGDLGTSTSGNRGTATAGNWGTSTSGDWGISTSGYGGTATSGDWGAATSGERGTATSGYRGTATSGDSGTSTSGNRGISTSGDSGISTSGDLGRATSGKGGEIRIRYYDSKAERYRTAVGYVGEGGIEANVAYELDVGHQFIKV